MSIIIKKNPNGDTRTASKNISYEEFQEANDMHKRDVYEVMKYLSRLISVTGLSHDFTKKKRRTIIL